MRTVAGTLATPALLKRRSRQVSAARKALTNRAIVVRSVRSSYRNLAVPLDGEGAKVIVVIAAAALDRERADT